MPAIKKCRADLFMFITRRDVPYTNNGSERALRMSVIFRKVTGCFRSVWGSQFYAATVSVIATGKLHGKTALEAIQQVIANPKEPTLASKGVSRYKSLPSVDGRARKWTVKRQDQPDRPCAT